MTDPYDDLFVEEQEPKAEIANIIKIFVRFLPSGETTYTPQYAALNNKQKILLHILASKVLAAKNLREQEGLKVQELYEITGIAIPSIESNVYGKIKQYVQSKAGRILVPNYRVHEVLAILQQKGETNDK